MKFSFLGGAEEVGMAGIFFETGEYRFLLDYGFTPGRPPTFPKDSPEVDLCLLTHAHVDHSGMIPWLCSRIGARVFATATTQNIAGTLARDNLKISRLQGFKLPFSAQDVESVDDFYENFSFEDRLGIEGLDIKTHSSGHIPGSTMFELNDGSRTLITGDMNTIDTFLVRGAKPMKCDNLFIESTYAGRTHSDRETLIKEFRDDVRDTVKGGGTAIIPAFAVGRSQEMLMILYDLGLDIYLDGMSRRIAPLLLENPRFLSSAKGLKKALSATRFIHNEGQRKKALDKPGIIVTPSGMLDGGPVQYYLKKAKDDEKNGVFLTGYQVEGSNGRRLIDRGAIDFGDGEEKVRCRKKFFDFSAHADHKELLGFIRECDPKNVILYHGDNREALAADISCNVILPKDGETHEIE